MLAHAPDQLSTQRAHPGQTTDRPQRHTQTPRCTNTNPKGTPKLANCAASGRSHAQSHEPRSSIYHVGFPCRHLCKRDRPLLRQTTPPSRQRIIPQPHNALSTPKKSQEAEPNRRGMTRPCNGLSYRPHPTGPTTVTRARAIARVAEPQ